MSSQSGIDMGMMRPGWQVIRVSGNWWIGKSTGGKKRLAAFSTTACGVIEKLGAAEDEPKRQALIRKRNAEALRKLSRMPAKNRMARYATPPQTPATDRSSARRCAVTGYVPHPGPAMAATGNE